MNEYSFSKSIVCYFDNSLFLNFSRMLLLSTSFSKRLHIFFKILDYMRKIINGRDKSNLIAGCCKESYAVVSSLI